MSRSRAPLLFGALGDIHGDFDSVHRIMQRHAQVPFWVCVGDVADAAGRYEPFDAPVYWIKGNNENFDAIASGDLPFNHHYIANGTRVTVDGVRIAGLGGTFAPTWYETNAEVLPHPHKGTAKATELADKRRHFVKAELEACTRMHDIDVLLTHEPPSPYRVPGRPFSIRPNPLGTVLQSMHPRLHLFGHHHHFSEHDRDGVPSVGLDLVSRSYLLLDSATLKYDVLTT